MYAERLGYRLYNETALEYLPRNVFLSLRQALWPNILAVYCSRLSALSGGRLLQNTIVFINH